ncbi:bifunctional riboflavin kinase/FAD synthetase [soil metagenome]
MTQFFESIDEIDLRKDKPVVLTIGAFDGVHLAHQELLEEAVSRARDIGGVSAALTFRNHPRSVIRPMDAPALLTDWPTKKELLQKTGIDVVAGLLFDEALMKMEAKDFVQRVIAAAFGARIVLSGPQFSFGRGGGGGGALLGEMGEKLGFIYDRREPVLIHGVKVSSTHVRELLSRGEVAEAACFLGRPHRNHGIVMGGDQLGRKIGYPTANMDIPRDLQKPADGVYAVMASINKDRDKHRAMMNLGWRPTVGGRDHRCEVHLIDFEGELVGKELRVDYISRLRGEQKFDGVDALRAQLAKDRIAALEALA